jgi:ABC-type uncharacterized transport system auxiliary subunit
MRRKHVTMTPGRTKQLLLTGAVFALALGCISVPPTRYYMLDMTPSQNVSPKQYNLVIERLRLTGALVREHILIETSATEAEYYASDAWLSNLDELVAEKLAAAFGPAVPGRPTLFISGTILGCEEVDHGDRAEGAAKIDLVFRTDRSGPAVFRKTYAAAVPADEPRAAAVVRALSRAFDAIAGEIIRDADALKLETPAKNP